MADKARAIKQRVWLIASMVLYGAALIVPCLNWNLMPPESDQGDMAGWQCLATGILGAPIIVPALCMVPNVLLGILWHAAFQRIPLTLLQAWSFAASAAVSLWLTHVAGADVRYGAWFWLASFVAASYASSFDEMERLL